MLAKTYDSTVDLSSLLWQLALLTKSSIFQCNHAAEHAGTEDAVTKFVQTYVNRTHQLTMQDTLMMRRLNNWLHSRL